MLKNNENYRGMVLPLAIIIISIILLTAFSRLFFSRQYLNVAARLGDYERSYQASMSGLMGARTLISKAVDFINNPAPETFPKREKASKDIRKIIDNLLDEKGEFKTYEHEFNFDTSLNAYILKNFADVENIVITVKLSKWKPIFYDSGYLGAFEASNYSNDSGYSFMKADPLEADYTLAVSVKCCVGNSKCSAGTFTRCRMVNILPPIIGKFTLFVRSSAGLNLNCVEDTNAAANFLKYPVIVNNGVSFDGRKVLKPEVLRDILDRQGWIYLGGDSRWEFNMTHAAANDELREAPIKISHYFYDITAPQKFSEIAGLKYYSTQSCLFKELGEPLFKQALFRKNAPAYSLTSRINLFGSRAGLSPSVVIGDAVRNYALLQGVYNSSSCLFAPFPYLGQADFNSAVWPGQLSENLVKAIKENFNNDYDKYKRRMSDIFSEACNVANLSLVEFDNAADNLTLNFDPADIAVKYPKFPTLTRLKVNKSAAQFFKYINKARITMLNDAGGLVYHGDDLSRFYDGGVIAHKCGYTYKTCEDFLKSRYDSKSRTLMVKGVVRILDGIVISDNLTLRTGMGGIVICDGDIKINGAIKAENGEPFTLMSLKGNISLNTSDTVEAALIAVSGKINLPSFFKIKGLIASKTLNLSPAKDGVISSLYYNAKFDPTDTKNYNNAYRTMISDEWRNYVE